MTSPRAAEQVSHVAHVMRQVALAVQDALDEDWTLGAMASVAGYAPHHFAHTFARVLGQPPLRYVRGLRLERAAHDLVFTPEKDLTLLGAEAGYGSYEAFRRAFVREFGLAPGALRRQKALRRSRPGALVCEPPAVSAPATCLGGPRLERVGAPQGVSLLAASFTDQAIADAWRRFYQGLPEAPGRRVGAAVSPWGWLAPGQRAREYRCVALGLPRGGTAGWQRWSMPEAWQVIFDFHGPTGELHEFFGWFFEHWLPRSSLRCTFAPLVTWFDEPTWWASRFQVSRAQVGIPVRRA